MIPPGVRRWSFRFLLVVICVGLASLLIKNHWQSLASLLIGQFMVPGITQEPLPPFISHPNLQQAVFLSRMIDGSIQITAETLHDAAFANGFVIAHERMWQLFLLRSVSRGELSSIIGNAGIGTDIFSKTMGFFEAAQKELNNVQSHSNEAKDLGYLETFTNGINYYLNTSEFVPLEFKLINLKSFTWNIVDSLAIARFLDFQMSRGWDSEYIRFKVFQKLHDKPDLLKLFTDIDFDSWKTHLDENSDLSDPLHIIEQYSPPSPPETLRTNSVPNDLLLNLFDSQQLEESLLENIVPNIAGSNAWAIHGRHTESGKAILANDPHLGLSLPSFWYPIHFRVGSNEILQNNKKKLKSPKEMRYFFDGFGLPGIPFGVIGTNGHVSWGVTLSRIDIQDLYFEKFNQPINLTRILKVNPTDTGDLKNHLKYFYDKKWIPADIETKTLVVRGSKNIEFDIVRTANGRPLISHLFPNESWTMSIQAQSTLSNHKYSPSLSFISLLFSHSIDEFIRNSKKVAVPSLNFVVAQGKDIAYTVSGHHPQRPINKYPHFGWESKNTWTDEPNPETFFLYEKNPPCGYVASANNKVIRFNPQFPYISSDTSWASGSRIMRIEQLLQDAIKLASSSENQKKITVSDVSLWQGDVVSLSAQEFIQIFKKHTKDWNKPPLVMQTKRFIDSWDGLMDNRSIAASVYHMMIESFYDIVVTPQLGKHITNSLQGVPVARFIRKTSDLFGFGPDFMLLLLKDENNSMIQQAGGIDRVLTEMCSHAFLRLVGTFGSLGSSNWGELHRVKLKHAFGTVLEYFNYQHRGQGDSSTVNMCGHLPTDNFFCSVSGVSGRLIFEDNVLKLLHLPGGSSGVQSSPYFLNMVDSWAKNRFELEQGTGETDDLHDL